MLITCCNLNFQCIILMNSVQHRSDRKILTRHVSLLQLFLVIWEWMRLCKNVNQISFSSIKATNYQWWCSRRSRVFLMRLTHWVLQSLAVVGSMEITFFKYRILTQILWYNNLLSHNRTKMSRFLMMNSYLVRWFQKDILCKIETNLLLLY
jgi:hypothetical protein